MKSPLSESLERVRSLDVDELRERQGMRVVRWLDVKALHKYRVGPPVFLLHSFSSRNPPGPVRICVKIGPADVVSLISDQETVIMGVMSGWII